MRTENEKMLAGELYDPLDPELGDNIDLSASALIEVGNDHRLADPQPQAAMLSVCEGRAGP